MRRFFFSLLIACSLIFGTALHAQGGMHRQGPPFGQKDQTPGHQSPEIIDFAPNFGPPGSKVVITGVDLHLVTRVTFNDHPTVVQSQSPGLISCIVPPTPLVGPIVIEWGTGKKAALPRAFVPTVGLIPTDAELARIRFFETVIDNDPDFHYLAIQQSYSPLIAGSTVAPAWDDDGNPGTPYVLPNDSFLFYVDEHKGIGSTGVGGELFSHPVFYGIYDLIEETITLIHAHWWPVVNGTALWDGFMNFLSSPELVGISSLGGARASNPGQLPRYQKFGSAADPPPDGSMIHVLMISTGNDSVLQGAIDIMKDALVARFPGVNPQPEINLSRTETLQAINQLAGQLGPGDTAILYLVGHGHYDNGTGYLATRDGKELHMSVLYSQALANLDAAADNLFIYMQSCNSGMLIDHLALQPGFEGVVVTPCQTDYSITAWQFFTWFFPFLDPFAVAMETEPSSPEGIDIDEDGDGKISFYEAFKYADDDLLD